MFEIVFSFNVKNANIFPCLHNIRLSYITYRNDSVLCQSECTCLHKTVNMVVFFVKSNENTYPKRESTHADVQSCPYNEKMELFTLETNNFEEISIQTVKWTHLNNETNYMSQFVTVCRDPKIH